MSEHRRKYKSGMSWCVWRWTEIPTEQIRRLHVFKTPLGALCIHWHLTRDPVSLLHDHPVTFLSFIPFGWYVELRKKGDGLTQWIVRRWFNFIRASDKDRHRIIYVEPGTVTVCLMSWKQREWGYHTDDGWVWWQNFDTSAYIGSES